MPSNPFASPYPVRQPSFLFGREVFVRQLINRLLNREYQVSQPIVGLTRSGKTSVLNSIARLGDIQSNSHVFTHFQLNASELVDMDSVLFVQIDCTGMASNTEEAFWTLIGRQLVNVLKDLDNFPNITRLQKWGFDDIYLVFRHLSDQGFLIVLLIDEFDRVIATLPSTILGNLRFFLDEISVNTVYVVATRRKLSSYQDITQNPYASFVGTYFDPTGYIGLLEEGGVEGFIHSLGDNLGVAFQRHDVDFALLVGGRHPDLTRIVCKYLFDARSRQKSGDLNYQAISDKILVEFEAFFVNFWPEISSHLRDILTDLAVGARSDVDENDLEELAALGLIIRNGKQFKLFSPVFESFLRKERLGAEPFVVVAQSQSDSSQSLVQGQSVFVQRRHLPRLTIFVPILLVSAIFAVIPLVLTVGTSQFHMLLHAGDVKIVIGLLAADFLGIGFIMWRLFIYVDHLLSKRNRERLRIKKAGIPTQSEEELEKRRIDLIEIIIAIIAGIVSSLLADLILHVL